MSCTHIYMHIVMYLIIRTEYQRNRSSYHTQLYCQILLFMTFCIAIKVLNFCDRVSLTCIFERHMKPPVSKILAFIFFIYDGLGKLLLVLLIIL